VDFHGADLEERAMSSACTPQQTGAGSTWTCHVWGMVCPKTETANS
jgi:hypothetical protein